MNLKNRFTLTAIAGLLTGNLPGAVLSPLSLYLLESRGLIGAKKWVLWVAAGVIIAPISQATVRTALSTKSEQTPSTVAQVAPSPTPVSASTPESSVPAPELEVTDENGFPANPATKEDKFRKAYYAEVDKQAGRYGLKRNYAMGVIQAWERDDSNMSAALNMACEDFITYKGDADAVAELAYKANEYTIPLDQLQVHYQAKFAAARAIGCQ